VSSTSFIDFAYFLPFVLFSMYSLTQVFCFDNLFVNYISRRLSLGSGDLPNLRESEKTLTKALYMGAMIFCVAIGSYAMGLLYQIEFKKGPSVIEALVLASQIGHSIAYGKHVND
jgi:hypothetical protein